ncbi:DUF697 domain-containing protein [Armatimonas sp.]|uniref:DUF697 domain-containing protein n=1 Tax=Armatimonas sp. TaxID=1872638 RepID=UPI003751A564
MLAGVAAQVIELMRPIFEYLTGDFTNLSLEERAEKARVIRTLAGPMATGITFFPIGPVDAVGITFVQIVMVRAIGNVYSQENCRITGGDPAQWISSALASLVNLKSLKEIVTVMGAGWLGQQVCLLILRVITWYIPGWMVGFYVGAWTAMVGHGAEKHFRKSLNVP